MTGNAPEPSLDLGMEARPGIVQYRVLEARRSAVREKQRGGWSSEEDAVLDEMDHVWWKVLTQQERDYLDAHSEDLVSWPDEEGEPR